MDKIERLIGQAISKYKPFTLHTTWTHDRERETDYHPWQHTYSGYVIIETEDATTVIRRDFSGLDDAALQQAAEEWSEQLSSLLRHTRCAMLPSE
jgi:hypothetical protein